jgi:hypothetical protein
MRRLIFDNIYPPMTGLYRWCDLSASAQVPVSYGERCDMTCLIVEPLDSEKGMPRKASTVENLMEFKDALLRLLVKANGCELDIN